MRPPPHAKLHKILKSLLLTLVLLNATGLRAEIRIEMSGVEKELRRNVLALLSVERYKDRDRIEADAVERLYRRVDTEVRSALKPFGYYQPEIHSELQNIDRGRNWRVLIDIKRGEPVHIASLDVEVVGPGKEDPKFTAVLKNSPLAVGQQLSHAAYEQLKGALQGAAIVNGYLDARMLRNELLVDTEKRTATASLAIDTGERYRFGATTIKQHVVRESLVRRFMRYQEGDPFDATKLRLTGNALDNTQFFSGAQVEVTDIDRQRHIAPVTISGEPSRRLIRFGPGYGTDTGPRLTTDLLYPRVNDRGHRLQLQLRASSILQSFDARYDFPIGDPARERFTLLFDAKQQRLSPSVRTSNISFTPSVSQVLGRWQRIISLAFARKQTDDSVNGRTSDSLLVPSLVYASVPRDYLGQDLFSRSFYAELLGSHRTLGAGANFLRLDLSGERSLQLGRRDNCRLNACPWHLLLRGEFGLSTVGQLQELPGDYRFYAGGDRSVRGFGYGALSPLARLSLADPLQRVGGRHLMTGTVEIERDLPRNLGVAAFIDSGNAVNRLGDPLAVAAGLGLRVRLPGITLGVDIAKAVHYPLRDPLTGQSLAMPGPRLHINISLRQ